MLTPIIKTKVNELWDKFWSGGISNPLNAIEQIILLELLNQSRNVSLNKVKIDTSISSLIKLKLGDTFRFVINHHIRHLKQIENILVDIKTA